jgi:two-component system nitrogen regulation response regulator NtrX
MHTPDKSRPFVLFITLLVLAFYALRRLTRPLRMLALAAEQIGKGIKASIPGGSAGALGKLEKSMAIMQEELLKLREQAHTQGMETAWRDIARVMAHEIKNPLTLAEDELFGHERGAFTGADKKRLGCLEQANGGTLFLDEIADMDLQVQAKLLRVIETGELLRLGATNATKVDVRLICATHKDLESLVAQGLFRHDLWYRISAFVLNVPGLDSRVEDIIPLARHFLKNVCQELGIKKNFTESAQKRLCELHYPGNIRELKHLITRVAVYTDSTEIDWTDIDEQHTESAGVTAAGSMDSLIKPVCDFRQAKIEFEKQFLKKALEQHNGNITATARSIGLAQPNLSRKLKELGIQL